MSEVIPAAIVHRYGPVSELEYDLMPGIGGVTTTTDLGTMPLYKAGLGGQAIYVSQQTIPWSFTFPRPGRIHCR